MVYAVDNRTPVVSIKDEGGLSLYPIDSSSRIFTLTRTGDGIIHTADSGKKISLEDFIRLVRIHASTSHRCCIEKIGFRTVAEGIRLVASMNEQD